MNTERSEAFRFIEYVSDHVVAGGMCDISNQFPDCMFHNGVGTNGLVYVAEPRDIDSKIFMDIQETVGITKENLHSETHAFMQVSLESGSLRMAFCSSELSDYLGMNGFVWLDIKEDEGAHVIKALYQRFEDDLGVGLLSMCVDVFPRDVAKRLRMVIARNQNRVLI